MQIISRRVNQGIVIGTKHQITVVGIGENWVDLEIQSSGNSDDDALSHRKTFRIPVTTAPMADHTEPVNAIAAAISVSRA